MHLPPSFVKHIHFVGIGGIGMSGIAEILHNQGYSVQGSDLSENNNIKRLRSIGIPIFIGHDSNNIRGAQVLVVSSAISKNNIEIVEARKHSIPIITRGEMLAEIIRLKKAIAISGTHGKTTTTSIISTLLNSADLDPTIINGGIINKIQTNAKLGSGEWFVVEADESDGSFLKLPSTINVITNIEPEHMDHYGSVENLEDAFFKFIKNLPFYGLGVVCTDNTTVNKIFQKNVDRRLVSYGFDGSPNFKAENLRFLNNGILFDVIISLGINNEKDDSHQVKHLKDVFLPMFGKHNVLNALAGIAVATELGIDLEIVKKSLSEFLGVKRRFTILGTKNGITFVDDYAHHPSEIDAVIDAAKQTDSKNVIMIFQPHRYTRLSALWTEFLETLKKVNTVIVLPVYTAGEKQIEKINSETFVQELSKETNSYYAGNKLEIMNLIKSKSNNGDIIIAVGAGDITHTIKEIFEEYE